MLYFFYAAFSCKFWKNYLKNKVKKFQNIQAETKYNCNQNEEKNINILIVRLNECLFDFYKTVNYRKFSHSKMAINNWRLFCLEPARVKHICVTSFQTWRRKINIVQMDIDYMWILSQGKKFSSIYVANIDITYWSVCSSCTRGLGKEGIGYRYFRHLQVESVSAYSNSLRSKFYG